MKRNWINEELIEHWTLHPQELTLIGESKTDHTLLGFAVLLKYFQYEGCFPTQKQDVPPLVIVHLATQVGIVPEKIIPYDWEGRTIKGHRSAIRTFLGVRETTKEDEDRVGEWLCQHVLPEQRQEDALLASVYTRYKELRIEPPTADRVRRLVHTALHRFDERLCETLLQRLSLETRTHLDALLATLPPEMGKEYPPTEQESSFPEIEAQEAPSPRLRSTLHVLKQDAGPVGLESVMQEIAKLERISQIGLPADLFSHISPKVLEGYRQRIAVEELQEVRRHPDPIRLLLATPSGDR